MFLILNLFLLSTTLLPFKLSFKVWTTILPRDELESVDNQLPNDVSDKLRLKEEFSKFDILCLKRCCSFFNMNIVSSTDLFVLDLSQLSALVRNDHVMQNVHHVWQPYQHWCIWIDPLWEQVVLIQDNCIYGTEAYTSDDGVNWASGPLL